MNQIYNKANGPKYDLIAEWIGRDKRILDVGCGAGEFSRRLISKGNHVVGVESSEVNYRIAGKKIGVHFGDFLEVNIGEEFDIVLFGDVLEHMYNPDEALNKAREIADEIILCVPNFDFWGVKILKLLRIKKTKSGFMDEGHVYFFNKRIIEKMLRDNDYEIIDFASPAPRRLPRFYTHISKLNLPSLAWNFIYRCKKRREA